MSDINESPAILNDFLSYIETIQGKSKMTTHEYFYDLRTFFRFIKIHNALVPDTAEFNTIDISDVDEKLLASINLSDLYSYMSYVTRDRDNSISARARKVASLKSFFNYLVKKARILDVNPAKELETPKAIKRLPKYLNVDESKKLLSAVEGKYAERDYAMLTLFLNCGLRLSELTGININKLKLKDRFHLADRTLTVIGKGNKERTIYLNHACVEAIEAYLRVRPIDGSIDKNALFLSERKKRISNKMVQYIVKKYIIAAGLDPERYSAHKLRHTAATLMYKHGNVDIRALQEILGHQSVSTTEIYTHVDNQQLKTAIDSNPLANFSSNKKESDENNKD